VNECKSKLLLLLGFALRALQVTVFAFIEQQRQTAQPYRPSIHSRQPLSLVSKPVTRQSTAKEVIFRMLINERINVAI
jgi:hypothetical protein